MNTQCLLPTYRAIEFSDSLSYTVVIRYNPNYYQINFILELQMSEFLSPFT